MQFTHTLCYILKNDEVLLGLKRRGFGVNKWNGYGGKVMSGESLEQAAVREVHEESGIELNETKLISVADISFYYRDLEDEHRVAVFITHGEYGCEPKESEEMLPKYFRSSELPYENMWVSDKIWLPALLSGNKVAGRIVFSELGDIEEHSFRSIGRWLDLQK